MTGSHSSRPRRIIRFLSKHRKPLALLGTAIAATIFALLLFPQEQPVRSDDTVESVVLQGDYTPFSVHVFMRPEEAIGGIRLEVDLYARNVKPKPTTLNFLVSPSTWGGPHGCDRFMRCVLPVPMYKSVSYTLGPWKLSGADNSPTDHLYSEGVYVLVPGEHYGLRSNDEYASAILPSISFFDTATQTATRSPLLTSYALEDADRFTWTGSLPSTGPGTIIWAGETEDLGGPASAVSGVDPAVQEQHDRDTFVSGALFGVAGGALVGAIQESLSDEDSDETEQE